MKARDPVLVLIAVACAAITVASSVRGAPAAATPPAEPVHDAAPPPTRQADAPPSVVLRAAGSSAAGRGATDTRVQQAGAAVDGAFALGGASLLSA